MNKLLSVRNDFVFKKLFGEPGSEDILKSLLESTLKEDITKLEIRRDTELIRDFKDDKLGIIDVRATINDKIKVNIEMQINNEYNINKRSFFYLSKLYVQDFKEGEFYKDLSKVIAINILDYNEFSDNRCHSIFRLKDQNNDESYYYDICEIHFFELSKIKRNKLEGKLWDWLRFIKTDNEEVIQMLASNNDAIQKAKKKLETLSSDEEVRIIAESRAKYLSDYNSNMDAAREKGLSQGLKEGLERGLERGLEQGLEQGAYKNQVSNILTFLEISPLKKELKSSIITFVESKPEISLLKKLMEALFKNNQNAILKIIS